jgi:zinc transport system substrate-binding protein
MTTRRPAPLLSILALGGASMLLAACGGGAGTAESSSAAAPATSAATSPTAEPSPSAEPLKVVAAFYPLQYAAEQVGGAAVEVTNLTPPGAEPHDLELTPQDGVALGEADLVLYSPGFQPALDEAIAQEAADNADDFTDSEYALGEFIDRYGPRLAHFNGVLQLFAQLGAPLPQPEASADG